MTINEEQIRLWYKTLKHDKDLVEIRLIKKGGKPFSGYFTDIETIIKALKGFYDDYYQVYFTLNKLDDSCYNKTQRDKLLPNMTTTNDDLITRRTSLLIDFDPVRVTDTSSTNEQLQESAKRAIEVESFLAENGFPEPIHGLSGNGCHLLYDIDLPNTTEVTNILKHFYETLSGLFTDKIVDIDRSVYNAARISKIFGSLARKGANTEQTPHRLSKITKIPKERNKVSLNTLMNVANLLPTKEEARQFLKTETTNGQGVDVDAFLQKHNIGVLKEETYHGGRKITLEHCVYNHDHKAPDAVIFVSSEGIPNYHCSHNSCADKNGWHHLREFFEPEFYKERENRQNNYNNNKQRKFQPYNKFAKPEVKIKEETPELGNLWLDPIDIEYVDTSKLKSIPTGFKNLDSKIVGLYLGETTIITGKSASGKSSWINQLCLNAVNEGFKSCIWSGELDDHRLMPWISQTAAGFDHVVQDETKENFYYADEQTDRQVKQWLSGKLYIYNNRYYSRWSQILYALNQMIDKGIELFILDNLMAMDISEFQGDSNEKQKQVIQAVMAFAKKNKVHCILVAHPRKEMTFIRKESISGSGDISNLVDNILIVHRVNQDFLKRAPEFLGSEKTDLCAAYSNVIEVSKNRTMGIEDYLAGLYFESQSRRFLNDRGENVHYGWEEGLKEKELEFDDFPPDEFGY